MYEIDVHDVEIVVNEDMFVGGVCVWCSGVKRVVGYEVCVDGFGCVACGDFGVGIVVGCCWWGIVDV